MADENLSMFCAVTEASPEKAQQYLQLTDGNVEQAVQLYFSNPDLGNPTSAPPPVTAQPATRDDPINIDEDDDIPEIEESTSSNVRGTTFEDDEAMARRLQEEMYGGGGGGGVGGGAGGDLDPEGVRAPMPRTTETLVGPGSNYRDDPNEMRAAIAEQMMLRQNRRRGGPGIFNQSDSSSIWAQDDPSNPEVHRQVLSRATGGASDQTAKSTLLADLFRPPFDLISQLSFSGARDEGREQERWILVNVQDPSIFDCQVLNRDIWKEPSIAATVREHFIFLQYNKDDPRGQEYVNYYFRTMLDNEDAYPHIAIVDPRTGEQVKTWSGSPGPKPADFLMDLHEFLDRYSLSMTTKNPVQTKRRESKKDVAQMTEDEMLEMAIQNSIVNGGASKDEDPDALTKPSDATNGKGKAPVSLPEAMDTTDMGPPPPEPVSPSTSKKTSAFGAISSTNPHPEPTSTGPETTRIQFRYSGGRIVRRFQLSDPVRTIYEWLKAAPLEGKEGGFELIAMGKNLIDMLDVPISEAGLRNGTVMVEFTED